MAKIQKGAKRDKTKILVDNPRIITIACNHLEDGQPIWQRLCLESVDNCPDFKCDKKMLQKFQGKVTEKIKTKSTF